MAGIWTPILGATRSVQAVQALTEAPSTPYEGVNLDTVESIAIFLHAPIGQTFTGTGRLLGYTWNGNIWVRSTAADIDMASASGLTDWTPGAVLVDSSRGRFQLVPAAVALSGAGTLITSEYLCTSRTGLAS